MLLQKDHIKRLKLSFITSAVLLAACGGGSDSSPAQPQPQPEPPAKPLISSFNSTLTLQDKGRRAQSIASRTTTEGKDSTLAYSVSTTLSNSRMISMGESPVTTNFPQLSQTFSFQLGKGKNAPILDILYNTVTQKVIDITLRRDQQWPLPDTLKCSIEDQINPALSCKGLTLNYAAASGKLTITFNNTILEKNLNPTPDTHTVTLNGQLTGELSIPPRGLQDIPQKSSGEIMVNDKVQKVLAVSMINNSTGRIRTGGSALLEDGSGIYFAKYPNGNYESSYILPDPADLIARPETTTQLNHQSTAQQDTFTLNTTRFNFDAPMSGETLVPLNISGTLTSPKPVQQLSYAPVVPAGVDANSYWSGVDAKSYWYSKNSSLRYSYIPQDISITLTNHNQVQLKNGFVSITLKNKQVQSIRLLGFFYSPSSPNSFEIIDYSCIEISKICQDLTVTPDGYGILFKDTKLGNNRPYPAELPAEISLNGAMIYHGR